MLVEFKIPSLCLCVSYPFRTRVTDALRLGDRGPSVFWFSGFLFGSLAVVSILVPFLISVSKDPTKAA